MRKATLQFLTVEDVGFWSSKIEGPFDVEAEVQPAKPLLASLKPYAGLGNMERQGKLLGLEAAMVLYIKKLRQASQETGCDTDAVIYSSCLENPPALLIGTAFSASLTYPIFQDDNRCKKHLICCTHNWRGKGPRSDYVFFHNEVVGSRKTEDAFGGKAVGHDLCLFDWNAALWVGKQKRHSLALIDNMLPLRPTVGK
jgi:hypothetical protein